MFNGVRRSWLILDKKLNFTLKLSSMALFFFFVEILNKAKMITIANNKNKIKIIKKKSSGFVYAKSKKLPFEVL